MEQVVNKIQKVLDLTKVDNRMAYALAEDDAVREQSRRRSLKYLEQIENEKNRMPEWLWNVLWFVLGMFFWESVPAMVNMVGAILKANGINIYE